MLEMTVHQRKKIIYDYKLMIRCFNPELTKKKLGLLIGNQGKSKADMFHILFFWGKEINIWTFH